MTIDTVALVTPALVAISCMVIFFMVCPGNKVIPGPRTRYRFYVILMLDICPGPEAGLSTDQDDPLEFPVIGFDEIEQIDPTGAVRPVFVLPIPLIGIV